MRVLLIEDDQRIARFVADGLRQENYVIDVANDGEDGRFLALNEKYDVVVLDLMLPGIGGEEILGGMREAGNLTPVIALTARDDVASKVDVLDLGADDYVTKPFALSELSARVRALIRRDRARGENAVRVEDLVIDPVSRRVLRGGDDLDLTTKEFSLLFLLAQNEGRVLTRRVIAEHVWESEFESFSNVIDVHVNRLRKKVDQAGRRKLIHTIRGVGYVLRSPR